ncbi:alpha/beta hydrolase family protein [Chitinophaga arvensicola]|uniref:Predicted dienelactone hydrolase n=1 Tax=Chitinophaga arvensicola TaxID=29529 RepID=A0A1I0S729_9BACT|nr:alpha/beta fold hydrolase [Chitinophaga arvensicola]SEW51559.1 Predicted dienelactone hydrolase [Chitinophaga arvensicola]
MQTGQNNIFTGCRQLQLTDNDNNISFPVLVQYPTYTPAVPTGFGPYQMEVSMNADIIPGQQFPLVVISHGNNGSHLLYRTISTYLAKNGFIVAMPEHYGNNRNNTSLENTVENLQLRPRHVSLTIDHLLTAPFLSGAADANKIAVIGHSMGGYTALALAGGRPITKEGEHVEVPHDNRVKAIVLMAPGAGWFNHPDNHISCPVLLLTAEHDNITPGWNAQVVQKIATDPSLVSFTEVKNAGHFAFISPFPAAMTNPGFPPSSDPAGFDRVAFHQQLPIDILDFLTAKLNVGARSAAIPG